MTNRVDNCYRIDCLQFCNWSSRVFQEAREGAVDAIHATVVYHGSFRDAVREIEGWNRLFNANKQLICRGRTCLDIARARSSGRTAVFLGFQNPSPIEDDLGLVEIFHALGIRFMQLSYNNQSLLASGWMEDEDGGITRMGRAVIGEMNRVGMAVDMSHSGERSTLEAIEMSERPVAVTHANPDWWRATRRNKSDAVIRALAESGGMIGFSLYPLHLKGGSDCTLEQFCRMVAETALRHGTECLGIGSDLCQGRAASDLSWMRHGRWSSQRVGEEVRDAGFPRQPDWFRNNRDFRNLADGLAAAGFSQNETTAILGGNWFRFLGLVLDGDGGQE